MTIRNDFGTLTERLYFRAKRFGMSHFLLDAKRKWKF